MPNIHKNAVSVRLAEYLTGRLCPNMPGLLKFVRYGAADDSVASLDSGPGQFFFADLFVDLLKKEKRLISKKSLKALGVEILTVMGNDEQEDWCRRTTKSMLEKIFEQIMTRELSGKFAQQVSDQVVVKI